MSADSSKYPQSFKQTREDPHLVTPEEVTDSSILDSVAGFINDVVPTSYTTVQDVSNQIQWAHFEQLDYDELSFMSDSDCEKVVPPPLVLVLGYSTGIQVWCISANGEAVEMVAWRHGTAKVVRILPTPHKMEGNHKDRFAHKRPLMALCDNPSAGNLFYDLSFLSMKIGDQVKQIKFRNPVLDVRANKRSVVVTFSEKIAVFDAFTLEDRCTVTTCYLSPGIQSNPIALGSRWLTFADKNLIPSRKSSGGCDSEGVQSYKATVIQCAKSLGKGIKEFGESVANSLTGSSSFKPGVVCLGSPVSRNTDSCQKGVITILDIECESMLPDKGRDKGAGSVDSDEKGVVPLEAVVAHFVAHNEAIVAMEFDTSGLLLLTADKRGYDFHVFRIQPHPVGTYLAAVHHLYILHRGDTTAKVQDMHFSSDSRWACVSTARGTTHVFPVTPYGGAVGVRTHTTHHVVNKMSRFHRSAGLTGDERSNSPVPIPVPGSVTSGTTGSESGGATSATFRGGSGVFYPYANPRFPPYPRPTVVNPLAQIRQPVTISTAASQTAANTNVPSYGGQTKSVSVGRQRSTSSSSDEVMFVRVAACFAAPRDATVSAMPLLMAQETATAAAKKLHAKPIESLFVIGCHGSLIQYDLEPKASAVATSREKVCDDTPVELTTLPKAQWVLRRRSSATTVQEIRDVPLPVDEKFLRYFGVLNNGGGPSRLKKSNFRGLRIGGSSEDDENNEDYWLSQVEIVTHEGPHRRLWMGPQFTFKTYTEFSGMSKGQQVGTGNRQNMSQPVNVPTTGSGSFTNSTSIECCGSNNSRELSPPMNTYHATLDEISTSGCELRLKEDLADAMLETSPNARERGGRRVLVSMKQQTPFSSSSSYRHFPSHPTSKVVNPLGTVVTLSYQKTKGEEEEEMNKYRAIEEIIHENRDEALFRPIVAPRRTTAPAPKLPERSSIEKSRYIDLIDIDAGFVDDAIARPISNDYSLFDFVDQKRENDQTSLNIDEESSCYFEKDFYENDKDFPFLENREEAREESEETTMTIGSNSIVKITTETFEDATDCNCFYDDEVERRRDSKIDNIWDKSETSVSTTNVVVQTKVKRPKAKLGVRISNKNSKNEEENASSKRSWSAVAAQKPKTQPKMKNAPLSSIIDTASEKDNIFRDISTTIGVADAQKKCNNKNVVAANVNVVKLIRIETPPYDEEASNVVEIIEPYQRQRRRSNSSSSLLRFDANNKITLSDEERSSSSPPPPPPPGEARATESDDSNGKSSTSSSSNVEIEINEDDSSTTIGGCVDETTLQDVAPITHKNVSKEIKKRSKKKRK